MMLKAVDPISSTSNCSGPPDSLALSFALENCTVTAEEEVDLREC